MPVPLLPNRFQPSFVNWPLQNARTAYQEVSLPTILVVPHRRTKDGQNVISSEVFDVIFRIEEAPDSAKVAGYIHRGILVPEFERFRKELSSIELAALKISIEGQIFEDKETGEEITFLEAEEGDFLVYTTQKGNLKDRVIWYPDADYYDLSSISLETHELKPLGKYIISWCAHYYFRIVSANNEVFCIDISASRLARLAVVFDHPGDVHQEFIEKTPSVYFEGKRFDQDETIKFFRPFADALQDVLDETGFLESLNWVDKVPAQLIPYLSFLLGWDLPYFPGATDVIRRRVLKNARKLQELKGSKRAVQELFELFGYIIDIINVWYRKDGSNFIAPNEITGDPALALTSENVCRTDPLVSDYSTNGFGGLSTPLLFRPEEKMTVEGWILKTSSALYPALLSAVDGWQTLESENCIVDANGFQLNQALHDLLPTGAIVGYSQILVDPALGSIDEQSLGNGPLGQYGIAYDSYHNTLSIDFGRHLNFADDERLFVFVTYEREKITIPDELEDLRSNRFDIRILERAAGEEVNPDVLDFLVSYLFRIKAFHSLLRKIIFTVSLADVYNVTDFCVGGDIAQRTGIDAGEFQVPPAIIPTSASICDVDSPQRGFKDEDIQYRNDVLAGLLEEFTKWKALDGSHEVPASQLPLLQSLSRVEIVLPQDSTDGCEFTNLGQNRKFHDSSLDLDHDIDVRSTACDISTTNDDYCYTGRVADSVELNRVVPLPDTWRCKPCPLGMGIGFYYTFSYQINTWCSSTDCISVDDTANIHRSFLETALTRIFAFGSPVIRFSRRDFLEQHLDLNLNEGGIHRPSLYIDKDNLHIPGHRFALMVAVPQDFTHPSYSLRPWDDSVNVPCTEDEPATVEALSPYFTTDTAGDEVLNYSVADLVYFGNGLNPDIPSLSDHTTTGDPLVTHSVFSSAGNDGHPAITLAQTVLTDSLGTTTVPDTLCIPDEVGKIFNSAADIEP